MTPEDPDARDADLLRRYRASNDARMEQPSEATRHTILEEARRVAESQARPEAVTPFDTREPAPNQSRWRFAAFGTVGAALFAVILMVPAYRDKVSRQTQSLAASSANVRPDPELGAAAERNPPYAAMPAPALEEHDRSARPLAKMAEGAPSQDKPREDQDLQSSAVTAQRSASRQRSAAADAAVAQAPAVEAKIAPASPPAYASAPVASLARSARRAGQASLLAAVSQEDLARVSLLLEAGASTAESDDAGRSPLLLAVLAERADIVRALLAHGADPNAADRAGQTPLGAARARDNRDIATALRQAGAREP